MPVASSNKTQLTCNRHSRNSSLLYSSTSPFLTLSVSLSFFFLYNRMAMMGGGFNRRPRCRTKRKQPILFLYPSSYLKLVSASHTSLITPIYFSSSSPLPFTTTTAAACRFCPSSTICPPVANICCLSFSLFQHHLKHWVPLFPLLHLLFSCSGTRTRFSTRCTKPHYPPHPPLPTWAIRNRLLALEWRGEIPGT